MLAMWLIPFFISIKFVHVRFLIIWCIFTSITVWIALKANRTPIERTTPRLFYKWFLLVHKITYFLGIAGYIGLMFTFFGLNFLLLLSPTTALDVSLLVMFYGVYYGVLSRDIAEICSDRMAAKIGVKLGVFYSKHGSLLKLKFLKYYTETGMPQRRLETNTCAICTNPIMVLNNEEALIEESFSLPCGHM